MGRFGYLERYIIWLNGEGCQFYTDFAAWRIIDPVTHACLNFPYFNGTLLI